MAEERSRRGPAYHSWNRIGVDGVLQHHVLHVWPVDGLWPFARCSCGLPNQLVPFHQRNTVSPCTECQRTIQRESAI